MEKHERVRQRTVGQDGHLGVRLGAELVIVCHLDDAARARASVSLSLFLQAAVTDFDEIADSSSSLEVPSLSYISLSSLLLLHTTPRVWCAPQQHFQPHCPPPTPTCVTHAAWMVPISPGDPLPPTLVVSFLPYSTVLSLVTSPPTRMQDYSDSEGNPIGCVEMDVQYTSKDWTSVEEDPVTQ